MDDLVQFLRARLDEDEQAARLITPGGYEPDEWRTEPSKSDRWVQVVAYSRTLGEPPEVAVRESDQPVAIVQTGRNEGLHIARHDPARILAEVDAKRRMLDEFDQALAQRRELKGTPHSIEGAVRVLTSLRFLKLLALPYSDHPDFREEWRP